VWAGFYWLRPLYMAAGRARTWVVIASLMTSLSLITFVPAAHYWGSAGVASVIFAMTVTWHAAGAIYASAWWQRSPTQELQQIQR